MNSFQIHNSEGVAIPIRTLDEEAAALWGKEVDPKWYANPTPPFVNSSNLEGRALALAKVKHDIGQWVNWYDAIGFKIAHPESKWASGWNNVKSSMWVVQVSDYYDDLFKEDIIVDAATGKSYTLIEIGIAATKQYLKPYYDLINHWEAKGYKPVQIKE